jgi:hypothetical protein
MYNVFRQSGKELRRAGEAVKKQWDYYGSEEQRKMMLDCIGIAEGPYRDSLVACFWEALPESVRAAIAKSALGADKR